MKYLLEQGEECGVYFPVNYDETPVKYCGMDITSTPYEFKNNIFFIIIFIMNVYLFVILEFKEDI